MTYKQPPPKPPFNLQLFNALGGEYAKDQMKLRQIKQKNNVQYEPPKPTGRKAFSGKPYEVTL